MKKNQFKNQGKWNPFSDTVMRRIGNDYDTYLSHIQEQYGGIKEDILRDEEQC